MTVTAPPRPPRPSDPVDREEVEALVEALIEEARQRARRRRRMYWAVAGVMAFAGVVGVTVFERTAQSQSASPALSARSSLAAATAESRIAFMTAVPKTRLPKGVEWQAEVYVMNADGSGKRRLARIAWNFEPPVWSPDGLKLAFERRLDPTKYGGQCGGCDVEVYVMNADGSGQQNLTRNIAYDGNPAWSPDGQKIAFVTARDSPKGLLAPKSDVYVMNADGSSQQRLTPNPAGDQHPVWSPDGGKVAFDSYHDRNWDVYVMNADGSGQQNLTRTPNPTQDFRPAWSPDGRKIAFTRDRNTSRRRDRNSEVYVMNADGSGQRNLTRNPAGDHDPAWSPDGQKIAFLSERNGNDEIYVMNADGSGQRNLTRNPASDGQPVWSPDGRKIGFVSNRGGNRDIYVVNARDIYVVNADGSGLRNLTRGIRRQAFGLAWSPAQK